MRRDAETMIALEVRQKWLDLQTARERLEVTPEAIAQADENLPWSANAISSRWVRTRKSWMQKRSASGVYNFYNSTYESVLARLRLHRAVGNL